MACMIPRKPGEDELPGRCFSRQLAADELLAVWAPDESHEAMRDLVRARWRLGHRASTTNWWEPSYSSMDAPIPQAELDVRYLRSSNSIVPHIRSRFGRLSRLFALRRSGSNV